MPSPAETAAIARLRRPETIRARCRTILACADADTLEHFRLHRERLDAAAERVLACIEDRYPHLDIPFHSRWRHFQAGGVDRWARLSAKLPAGDREERARASMDLAVTSVLLDAGAGDDWRYEEPGSQRSYARSEGLAVASFHMFAAGTFSSNPDKPLQADAGALTGFAQNHLEQAFQIRPDNALVGAAGRSALVQALGRALAGDAELFGEAPARVGNLFDYLAAHAVGGKLPAETILAAVLRGLAPIWPGRVQLGGENLGDVWHHDAIQCDDPSSALVPFHKLSQWLTYSLVEPLEEGGIRVTGLDALTGLAEYRNGGLFLDLGVLTLKRDGEVERVHDVGSELVVEWRALTLALLDELAALIRTRLQMDAEQLPLVRILEGGTWEAGRRAARTRRANGGPPLTVRSDGTVF
jgi:hypothetical protein